MMLRVTGLLALLLTLAAPTTQAQPRQVGIPAVVAPDAAVELVKEGFGFIEGPVGTADGGLYFTDLLAMPNRIYRLDAKGEAVVFRENTNGANGLAFDAKQRLHAAEGNGKRIVRMDARGAVTEVTTEAAAGQPFLSLNDLIFDSRGGLYFTDPGPRPIVAGRKAYVYYLPAGATHPLLVDDGIVRPNGIALSNDGRRLFVDDTVGGGIYAFDVQGDGRVKGKRLFAQIRDIPAGQESGADGMAIDREDRLYVTSVTGVQVFDKAGGYLGTIRAPRQPANVAFSGPDRRVLYMTAREGLYRVQMLSQGPTRPGK